LAFVKKDIAKAIQWKGIDTAVTDATTEGEISIATERG